MTDDQEGGPVDTTGSGAPTGTPPDPPVRPGRKRDHTRDAALLDAALDVLADVGYDALTIDAVAARAKAGKGTVYRRWSSKHDLVLDAIERLQRTQVDAGTLPDTGSLRGDLLALFQPLGPEQTARRLAIMAGLASTAAHDDALAEAVDAAAIRPWAQAHLLFMTRAVERGEIPGDAPIQTASQILPTMAAYRSMVQRRPFTRDFLEEIVEGIVLPALRSTTR